MEYVNSSASANPTQATLFTELGRLFQKRLWHQLSKRILELTAHEFFQTEKRLVSLYENFVTKFAKKINQLDLVNIAIAVSKQFPDASESVKFLQTVLKLVESDDQAAVLCRMELCRRELQAGNHTEAKNHLEEGKTRMEKYMGIMDASVHGYYYRAQMDYAKAKGRSSDYYNNCVVFLTYTPYEKLSSAEQIQLASDVGLAALTGDTIYNFGELLNQPLLKVLEKTEWAWLPELLLAFNRGNINAWSHAEKKAPHPMISKNIRFLNEKIRIMAFTEMVLGRPASKRNIDFKEIATRCELKHDDVEIMLMRAFSLKVVRGIIDQVEQTVRIKWVQPRVLELGQISSMRDRLKQWTKDIHETTLYLEENAHELVV